MTVIYCKNGGKNKKIRQNTQIILKSQGKRPVTAGSAGMNRIKKRPTILKLFVKILRLRNNHGIIKKGEAF